MSRLEELSESFLLSWENMWESVVEYAPTVFGALLVLIIGWIIAIFLGKFAERIILFTRIDKLSERIGAKREVKNFGFDLNLAALMGWIVKWFILIVTFVAVIDILNIQQLSLFLERFVLYLPNVIVAVVILAVGLIVGTIFRDAIWKALKAFSVTERVSAFLGNLAKWAVFVFALLAALVQLGVASELIQILFTGFVLMLAVAGGLAFGLGGKDHASKVLDWIENEIIHKG
jgi:small-conductance mechanosensitive channel